MIRDCLLFFSVRNCNGDPANDQFYQECFTNMSVLQ